MRAFLPEFFVVRLTVSSRVAEALYLRRQMTMIRMKRRPPTVAGTAMMSVDVVEDDVDASAVSREIADPVED